MTVPLSSLSNSVADTLIGAYEGYLERVYSLSAQLSEKEFWTRPYPYGNSFGHLVLHLTGNLKSHIGAKLANTGYVRDREREFNETAPPSKAETLKELERAVEIVVDALKAQTVETWGAPYQLPGAAATDRFGIFFKCAAHFDHHIGQMIYLEKELHRSVS